MRSSAARKPRNDSIKCRTCDGSGTWPNDMEWCPDPCNGIHGRGRLSQDYYESWPGNPLKGPSKSEILGAVTQAFKKRSGFCGYLQAGNWLYHTHLDDDTDTLYLKAHVSLNREMDGGEATGSDMVSLPAGLPTLKFKLTYSVKAVA